MVTAATLHSVTATVLTVTAATLHSVTATVLTVTTVKRLNPTHI
jgi:hypothetical protein